MKSRFSSFASRLSGPTGTRLLMDDLGEVLAGDQQYRNLGGGNPAAIPAMQALFRAGMQRLLNTGEFDRVSGSYDGPQGNRAFLIALRDLLRNNFGWPIEVDNIAMTAGSQASFFMLFNLFSGPCEDGVRRHIKLPMTPEYIGYGDVAVTPGALSANRPAIELLEHRQFKYKVDFAALELEQATGAVCVSRPTNPTGNVIATDELERLIELTAVAGVPLILDNAYGVPFPGIIFDDVEPVYAEHIVHCMSLSKLGLPGLRTGIVVAHPAIIEALRSMNAILNLATGSLGAMLATNMIASGEILEYARNIIRPYYHARVREAVGWCAQYLDGIDYHLHKPEGAIFLWLWFPNLPVAAQKLYERLKARGVLVIPGHYFFPGLDDDWTHKHECIRISYATDAAGVEQGIRIIGEEVRHAFAAV